jgi:solute carrier family 25 citrate transporter 1
MQRKPTQLESLSAGMVAGAVEGFITYPAEFVKTKAQFESKVGGKVSHIQLPLLTRSGSRPGTDSASDFPEPWR